MKHDDSTVAAVSGDRAIELLKQLGLALVPCNFELCYTYTTGLNRNLNREIDALLHDRSGAQKTTERCKDIYDRYLSRDRISNKVEEVGDRIAEEITELAGLIDETLGNTTRYGSSLKSAWDDLQRTNNAAQIGNIVKRLVTATVEVEQANRGLKKQLAESKNEFLKLEANLDAVRHESLTDPLTGLGNRKHFDQSLERAIDNSAPGACALVIADIDHFKRFNDSYGHQVGDQVLQLFAKVMKEKIKQTDIACRYGGEEFAVILPQTSLTQARGVADRIRHALATRDILRPSSGQNLGRVTLSAGVSAFVKGDAGQSLIERADAALYAAKAAGRNQVLTQEDLLALERGVKVAPAASLVSSTGDVVLREPAARTPE